MLFKIERTILRKVSKQPHENQINIASFKKYSGNDIYHAFINLKEKGYFESVDASIAFSNFSYVLTTKGRYYKEYIFRTFFHNILVPFIVALLTTIATLYLEKFVENNYPQDTSCYTSDYGSEQG